MKGELRGLRSCVQPICMSIGSENNPLLFEHRDNTGRIRRRKDAEDQAASEEQMPYAATFHGTILAVLYGQRSYRNPYSRLSDPCSSRSLLAQHSRLPHQPPLVD